jgi:hypothetical protein
MDRLTEQDIAKIVRVQSYIRGWVLRRKFKKRGSFLFFFFFLVGFFLVGFFLVGFFLGFFLGFF